MQLIITRLMSNVLMISFRSISEDKGRHWRPICEMRSPPMIHTELPTKSSLWCKCIWKWKCRSFFRDKELCSTGGDAWGVYPSGPKRLWEVWVFRVQVHGRMSAWHCGRVNTALPACLPALWREETHRVSIRWVTAVTDGPRCSHARKQACTQIHIHT